MSTAIPDSERMAEWWVLLNVWEWPHDLAWKPNPPGGMSPEQEKYAIRGAHAVVESMVSEDMKSAAWRRHKEIIREHQNGSYEKGDG